MPSRDPGTKRVGLLVDRNAELPALRALNYRCTVLRDRTPPVNWTLEVTGD